MLRFSNKIILLIMLILGLCAPVCTHESSQAEQKGCASQQVDVDEQENVDNGACELDDIDDIPDDIVLPEFEKPSRVKLMMAKVGMYVLLKYVACKQAVIAAWSRVKGCCGYEHQA